MRAWGSLAIKDKKGTRPAGFVMRNTDPSAYTAVPTGVTTLTGHVRRNQRSRCRNPFGHVHRYVGHVPGITGHVEPEYSDKHGKMKDAPFYDLTYSPALGVHGISLNRESWFEFQDVVEAFSLFGFSKKQIAFAVTELQDILVSWSKFAQESGLEASDRMTERRSEILSGLSKMA